MQKQVGSRQHDHVCDGHELEGTKHTGAAVATMPLEQRYENDREQYINSMNGITGSNRNEEGEG